MRFISLFAGVGGFDLGMERAGHECVAMVEYDKHAAGVLAHRFPGVPLFCDVRKVSAADLPDADFITYGFPCQDLSTAGKREGLNGDRSGLFFEATRLIRGMQRRGRQFALAENVAGLLSADDGVALARCVRELLDCGARDVGWRTLDSQWFGVAQRRRRVFLVSDFAGERADQVLALAESLRGHPAPSREAGKGLAPTVTQGAPFSRTGNERVETQAIVPVVANTLTRRMHKGINSTVDEGQTPVVCGTLDCGCGDAASNSGLSVRRLTPRECERLQGFPDDWTSERRKMTLDGNRWIAGDIEQQADSPRYKQLGNAVTVNVAEWIGRRIRSTSGAGK